MGQVATASGGYNAARWDRHGRGTDLGTLPAVLVATRSRSPDDESVAGDADTAPDANPNVFTHAVRWDRHGRIIDLGAPELASMANDVNNDDDTAVGEADDGAPRSRCALDKRGIDRRPRPAGWYGVAFALDRTATSCPVATSCGTR